MKQVASPPTPHLRNRPAASVPVSGPPLASHGRSAQEFPASSAASRRWAAACVGSLADHEPGSVFQLIDSIRKQIENRLDQLLGEAEKLRRALAALDPRGGSSQPSPTASPRPRPAPTRPRRTQARRTTRRTAPGATKAHVLGALSDSKAMTAGEVAAATGLARATVSTTLSKLAKSGDVLKAERGYRLP